MYVLVGWAGGVGRQSSAASRPASTRLAPPRDTRDLLPKTYELFELSTKISYDLIILSNTLDFY